MKRRGAGHTSITPGARAFVLMRSGQHFVAKFHKKSDDDRWIEFHDHEPVRTNKVRTIGYYRPTGRDDG